MTPATVPLNIASTTNAPAAAHPPGAANAATSTSTPAITDAAPLADTPATANTSSSSNTAATASHNANALTPRLVAGLTGIFLAAMIAGINNRVGSLTLADLRGASGFGLDDGSWITTVYSAGELLAMPVAGWFAITLSLRRFHLMMLGTCSAIACVLPFVHDMSLLLILRALQGLTAGALIPLLMMAALRFLPPSIRLYALALYSMTATFAPNVSTWLAGLWTDQLLDLRMVYWQVIPAGLIAGLLVSWGVPQDMPKPERFGQANWFGLIFGALGLTLVAVGLDQGNRLEWFASPLISTCLVVGLLLVAYYLFTEWHHPAPFIKLQLLSRRNLGLGFTIFFSLLVIFLSGSLLPSLHLGHTWDYRAQQSAPIGLMIGLPQLIVAPAVSLLLYRKWVDARAVMALGLACLSLSCVMGAHLTSEWMWTEFIWAQSLQAIGQPLAVVALLFLSTSVVQPMEGPYVSGMVNLLRALGTLAGSAAISRLIELRTRFHSEMLLDHAARAQTPAPADLASTIAGQAAVLSIADAYWALAAFAAILIPLVFALQYIPSPTVAMHSKH